MQDPTVNLLSQSISEVKSDVRSLDSKIEKNREELIAKMDKHSTEFSDFKKDFDAHLDRLIEQHARMNVSLEKHMMRTDQNEAMIKTINKSLSPLIKKAESNKAVKDWLINNFRMITTIATGITAIAALIGYLTGFFEK